MSKSWYGPWWKEVWNPWCRWCMFLLTEIKQRSYFTNYIHGSQFSKFCPEVPVNISEHSCVMHLFALWRTKSERGLSNATWNILIAIKSIHYFFLSYKLWSNADIMQWTCDICNTLENFHFWKTSNMTCLFCFPEMNVLYLQIIE